MKNNLFKSIVESGVKATDQPSKRRAIIFSNYISLILIAANFLVVLLNPRNYNVGSLIDALIGFLFFIIPIALNRFSYTTLSKIYLCWVPPILVMWLMILGMKEIEQVPISVYGGLRIYILSASCVPYLLLDKSNLKIFILGILPSLLIITFCDSILNFFDVGHSLKGAFDSNYDMVQVRSLIAYVVIGGSCISLRFLIDKSEMQNDKLIGELEIKNSIIKNQAESELQKLNVKLISTIEELSKRELILKQSQKTAKVGSWEFILPERTVYWSDEMYEIFGVDKNFDLQKPDLVEHLFGGSAFMVNDAVNELIQSQKHYDFIVQTKTPLGYIKWVRVVGFPMVVDGAVVAATGIVHDVTRFKESEERLKEKEQNYRSLFEQASDAILVVNFSGGFFDVNASACDMLGYTRSELLQMNMSDLIDKEQLLAWPIQYDRFKTGEHVFSERLIVRKDGTRIFVEANVRMIDEGKVLVIGRNVTDRKAIENENERVRHVLNERVKELTTLYKCGQILQVERKPVHEVLQEIVTILPDGWQYPFKAAARISLAEMEFVTANFGPYKHRQFTEFTTRNQLHGTIEVVYLEECPEEIEGPFLAEERNLITMIAEMIRIYLSRRYEAEALRRSEANQSATINNTSFFIWSVNREYEIISYNKPFAEFSKNQFGLDVKVGIRLTDEAPHLTELKNRWTERYNRALAGETFKINSELKGHHFEYSLNPIMEEGKIIGVSVFGEDISERLKYQKDMLAINKQLGELRLMSLRSVMNPHFIFNCLNSIQYYIMDNDQKNAVTYLSTFSKLIRAILTNSVHNKVRLAEELETLKLYIQLEALRFENKFDSIIYVDPELDIETIEIPSMLIQPYAENAILHGLYNKEGKGLLKISISAQNGMILVEIEDNGIGRAAATTVKQLNLPRHKSMGTALTEERLRLINEDGAASVEIIDLEMGGKPAGTLVKVWIKE